MILRLRIALMAFFVQPAPGRLAFCDPGRRMMFVNPRNEKCAREACETIGWTVVTDHDMPVWIPVRSRWRRTVEAWRLSGR